MSANRKRTPAIRQKAPEGVNKKALIWICSIFGVIVVGMALLLIFTN